MIRNKTKNVTIAKDVELALTPFQKSKGLMGRKDIPEDYAMLFDFGKEKKEGFWMLFMRTSIDMIFIDSDKKIVDIKHSVKPISLNPLTWRIYYPKKPARWVLEVQSGLMKKMKSVEGDELSF